MFNLLWVSNFIKIGANISVGTKFARIYNFRLISSTASTIFIISMFDLFWDSKFHKNHVHCNFEIKSTQVFNFGWRSAISNIIFMINELELPLVPKFIALEYISFLGSNFPGMRGLMVVLISKICCLGVILFILVVTWCYCSLPSGYCWLLLVTWWLLVVTACFWCLLLVAARYSSFPLLVLTVLVH